MPIHVEHVVPYIGDDASGPAWSVPALCSSLAANAARVRLHVLGPLPDRTFDFDVCEYPRQSFPFRHLGVSKAMKLGLRNAAGSADILHNHSLWMMPNVYPAKAVRGADCRLVVSPRGTLSKWALSRSRWAKRIAWALAQGDVLRSADCLVATAESEFHDIRSWGLRAPVAIIPNGIDCPEFLATQPIEKHRMRLLFFGRLHPVKGVDMLIRVWVQLQDRFSDWELHIVGPLDGHYPQEMRALADSLRAERLTFAGELRGQDKSDAYASSDLFVLPTHSENFGMAVAEALAHGVPTIVSKGAPWEGLESEHCGWWVDLAFDSLVECLSEAMSLSRTQLAERGRRGRDWMIRDFSWQRIGRLTLETYRWLLGGGNPPGWIIFD